MTSAGQLVPAERAGDSTTASQPDAQKGTVFISFHTAQSHDSHLPSKSSSQHVQDDDLFQFGFYK